MTVRELTAAIASGNPEAFARLYRERFDRLFAVARGLTRQDEAFCLDVVHDALLKVVRRIPVLETEAALDAWLRTVVRSAALDRLRAERRRRAREQRHARPVATTDGADEHDLAELDRLLAELDEPGRDLVLMRFRFGWTLQRIGRALGLSTGAVDARLRSAFSTMAENSPEVIDDS